MEKLVLPESFIARGKFSDVTRSGILNVRLVQHLLELTEHTDATEEEKEQFMELLLMTVNKLGAVWYHKQCYQSLEAKLVAEARAKPILQGQKRITIDCIPELYYEFDAFLVQIKSCLDHLVKVPRVFVGRGWSLTTFGSRGQDVVNAVRNNLPQRFKASSESLLALLETHLPWIEQAIQLRDRINHLQEGGVQPDLFYVYAVAQKEGEPTIYAPMWGPDLSVSQGMELAWGNLYRFCEDFLGISAVLRLQPDKAVLHVPIPVDRVERTWRVTSKEEMDRTVAEPGWRKYVPSEPEPRRPHPNDLCHCGSGRKYKKCHREADEEARRSGKGKA